MDSTRLKRISFRAWRRGFREADLVLGPFADSHAQNFAPDDLDRFERLLDQNDHDLYAWAIGAEAPPPAFEGPVMEALRAFCRAGRRLPG